MKYELASPDIEISHTLKQDQNHVLKYHTHASRGLEACIDKEISDVKKNTSESFKFYNLFHDGNKLGYFGAENQLLVCFYILPQFRKKDILLDFLSTISKHFDNKPYKINLYAKNKKAIDFFLKNKAQIEDLGIYDNELFCILRMGD